MVFNMSKIIVELLNQSKDYPGRIDVWIKKGVDRHIVKGVCPNIVRCALGYEDMEYLLNIRNAENFATITESHLADFFKYANGQD